MMKYIFVPAILCFAYASANGGDCTFEKLTFKKKGESSGSTLLNRTVEIVLEGGDGKDSVFEGPAWVVLNGKKKCQIEGGIFSGMYFSKSKNLLMTEEYSGSCGQHRIVDPKTCKHVGEPADYCGAARLKGFQLINEPPCEAISNDGKTASCSTGKVFEISKATCELSVNKKASLELTKKELGIELPFDKSAYKIINAHTPQAAVAGKEP